MAKNGFLAKQKARDEIIFCTAAKRACNVIQYLAIVALNDEFGFGEARAEKFLNRLQVLAEEHEETCTDDYDLGMERLRRRVEQILKCKVERTD